MTEDINDQAHRLWQRLESAGRARWEKRERRWYFTDEEDLANAYLAALEAVETGHGRFEAVFIAGDEDEEETNLSKARRLLGWMPRSHLKVKVQ